MTARIIPFPMKKDLPNRIRAIREQKKWTLEALANEVGCSIPQISDLELGNVQLNYKWMQRVAEALGCSPGDLLNPSDNPRFSDPRAAHFFALYENGSDAQRDMLLRLAEAAVGYNGPPVEERAKRTA